MQVAHFVNLRAGVTAANLYADLLVANLNQIIDDFTEEGLANYEAAHAVGIGGAGEADFRRTAGEVEDLFATHTLRHDEAGGQSVLRSFDEGAVTLPYDVREAGNADEAEDKLVSRIVVHI